MLAALFFHLIRAPVLQLGTRSCPVRAGVVDVPINTLVAALSSSPAPTGPAESLRPMCRPDWSCAEEHFLGPSEATESLQENAAKPTGSWLSAEPEKNESPPLRSPTPAGSAVQNFTDAGGQQGRSVVLPSGAVLLHPTRSLGCRVKFCSPPVSLVESSPSRRLGSGRCR